MLVGMGSIVLNGATIGEGSVIGAGAVITEGKQIPPGSVVVGVPGKIVKEADSAQQEKILKNSASYIELAKEYTHHE